jgi:hypothetical protein
MTAPASPIRLFLDAGVIIEGCFGRWGAAKGVLILATLRANFTVVLAAAIEREVQRAVARRAAGLDAASAQEIARSLAGWIERVRIERWPLPSEDEIRAHLASILPVIRHVNDVPAVVTALRAQPDWVLSTNTAHWNSRLTARTGLRVATPLAFLSQLHLPDVQ